MCRINAWLPALLMLLVSCGQQAEKQQKTITVSIPPFRYFVEALADSEYVVNVMLPPGADHHSWEPLPGQVAALAGSEAFIINGHLGFELSWMERFREVNPDMYITDLSSNVNLIRTSGEEVHDGHDHGSENIDPHYWLSPAEGMKIASSVRDLLIRLNPASAQRYNDNYEKLAARIISTDSLVRSIVSDAPYETFMIFHPALGYFARDYGFEQVAFENEGKEPSPARMKELIDMVRSDKIRLIFVQAEYDLKGARVLEEETGAKMVTINPMNPEWERAVLEVANALGEKE